MGAFLKKRRRGRKGAEPEVGWDGASVYNARTSSVGGEEVEGPLGGQESAAAPPSLAAANRGGVP